MARRPHPDDPLTPPEDDDAPGAGPSPSGLTGRQEAAVIAMVCEPSIERAAKQAEVGVRTLKRWLDDPPFIVALRKARRQAFTQAIAMCQRYAPMAAGIIAKVASDPTTPAHVKVSAASQVLKFGREGLELDDLAARIEMLEQQYQQLEKNQGSRS